MCCGCAALWRGQLRALGDALSSLIVLGLLAVAVLRSGVAGCSIAAADPRGGVAVLRCGVASCIPYGARCRR